LRIPCNKIAQLPSFRSFADAVRNARFLRDRYTFLDLAVDPRKTWAGLYEMTPDHHPILGPAPGVPGFFFANGFSGHGVMHSPATGKILADLILKGETDLIDARLLNFERFAEGRQIHETAVL
jgi:sarcosine oxidase subunit beta